MCSRTQENNKNKVGPVIWDTLYIHWQPHAFTLSKTYIHVLLGPFYKKHSLTIGPYNAFNKKIGLVDKFSEFTVMSKLENTTDC